jgi:hypothetical protein
MAAGPGDTTSTMTKHAFQVLPGGRSEHLFSDYRFVSGEITDTRLMGVLGMHLHWELPYPTAEPNLHQYYYYDIEELGLETYRTYSGDDPIAVELASKNLFGGLGARMRPLSEREGRYLAAEFINETKRKKQMLPDEAVGLEFITRMPVFLTSEEHEELVEKMCTDIRSDYQLIHYYLMRIFGMDLKGASYLSAPAFLAEGGPQTFLPEHATFLRNSIEEYVDEAGHESYLCESLVETENKHWLVISELETAAGRITGAKRKSAFEVSLYEASMLLSRWEYVTVYEILRDPDEFDIEFTTYTLGAMRTDHVNGEMFMQFKRDNSHVDQRVFNLSDDIDCLYYVTDFGQLILAAYSLEAIALIEDKLHRSPLSSAVFPTARYQFQEPVLYEFAQSDFDDFEEFLKVLK